MHVPGGTTDGNTAYALPSSHSRTDEYLTDAPLAPATRRGGEVVFNTSLTGYQEVFTDPSYSGQIVCLTYPHIGNVGANLDDQESARPYIEALIVREFSLLASNWRSTETAAALPEPPWHPRDLGSGHPRAGSAHPPRRRAARRGLHRRHARRTTGQGGARASLHGRPGAGQPRELREAVPLGRRFGVCLFALGTMGGAPAGNESRRHRVVAYDFGIKQNILRLLVDVNCDVTVVPARTSAEDVLAMKPDGVFLSNGPGDPEPVTYAVENIRKLLGRVPIFGICLGHQLCGLALGGRTYKLKFGHHGSNHPVKNLLTGHVEITAQNHGFVVDPDSLPSSDVEITHVNLNDQTNEGMRHRSLPLFSVQYHPEASPGPHDSHYLFGSFIDMMNEAR